MPNYALSAECPPGHFADVRDVSARNPKMSALPDPTRPDPYISYRSSAALCGCFPLQASEGRRARRTGTQADAQRHDAAHQARDEMLAGATQPKMTDWRVQPIELAVANLFVKAHHRHAEPVVGNLFSLGLFDQDWSLHGAVIVGRPVARALDDGATCEVTRLVTYGTPNACSKLYGAAQREAVARGYLRVVTYTLTDEPGASPRAANFQRVALVRGRQWDTPSRPRRRRAVADRWRWEWTR